MSSVAENAPFLLPLVAAVLPTFSSSFFQTAVTGVDVALLGVTFFWLYLIVRKPEELYSGLREKRIKKINQLSVKSEELLSSEQQEKLRKQQEGLKELKRMENKLFVFSLLSPILGALGIHLLSTLSPAGRSLLSRFDLFLFLLASSIRPLLRVFASCKEEIEDLQQAIDYPPDEVETIRRELMMFRAEIQASREIFQQQSAELVSLQSDLNQHRQKMRSLLNKLAQRIQHLKLSEQDQRMELLNKIEVLEKQAKMMNGNFDKDSLYSIFQREGLRQKAWKLLHFVLRSPENANIEPAGSIAGGKIELIK